jgi:hypothetical protein
MRFIKFVTAFTVFSAISCGNNEDASALWNREDRSGEGIFRRGSRGNGGVSLTHPNVGDKQDLLACTFVPETEPNLTPEESKKKRDLLMGCGIPLQWAVADAFCREKNWSSAEEIGTSWLPPRMSPTGRGFAFNFKHVCQASELLRRDGIKWLSCLWVGIDYQGRETQVFDYIKCK